MDDACVPFVYAGAVDPKPASNAGRAAYKKGQTKANRVILTQLKIV